MIRKNLILRLAVFITAMSFMLIISCKNSCPPPEKPKSLTENTVWFGDCDGGNWIELVNVDKEAKLIRFKIYRDYDGTLEMDADFNLGNCDFNDINKSNWTEKIVGYINETISLKGDKDCFLKPVYPAYGGDEWETKKNKENN